MGGTESAGSSVFTLQHWTRSGTASRPLESEQPQAQSPGERGRRQSSAGRRFIVVDHRARLMLIKAQETALNFLVRWFLLEESARFEEQTRSQLDKIDRPSRRAPARKGARASGRVGPLERDGKLSLGWSQSGAVGGRSRGKSVHKHEARERVSRSSLLMRDVNRLPERSLGAILKFIFFRWLTWANLLELLLIILLVSCCAYQCYELLEDYYQYPTHITVTSVFNDDFRLDLPALTICDNNRVSRQTLKSNYPELNESHYMAMTLGTFHSAHNFTLEPAASPNLVTRSQLSEWFGDDISPLQQPSYGMQQKQEQQQAMRKQESDKLPPETEINWAQVIRHLSGRRPSGHFRIVPQDDRLIDTLICANVWGEQMPCRHLRRIQSIQHAALCHTMFHDSVLWDASEPSVRQLESAIARRPATIKFGDHAMDGDEYMELDPEAERQEEVEEEEMQRKDEGYLRIDMANMEMIRMRINFQSQDYANHRGLVGGRLAVHTNSLIGEISHKSYELKPGYWYTYYVERSDYQRLPPPYSTHCFDYDAGRYHWNERLRQLNATRRQIYELTVQQAHTNHLLPRYADILRMRSMGRVSSAETRLVSPFVCAAAFVQYCLRWEAASSFSNCEIHDGLVRYARRAALAERGSCRSVVPPPAPINLGAPLVVIATLAGAGSLRLASHANSRGRCWRRAALAIGVRGGNSIGSTASKAA